MKLFVYKARMFSDYGVLTKVIIVSDQDAADKILKGQVIAENSIPEIVIVNDMCRASEIDLDPETYNRRGQVWYVVKQEEITERSSYTTFYLEKGGSRPAGFQLHFLKGDLWHIAEPIVIPVCPLM
jgi:hypothetical protein